MFGYFFPICSFLSLSLFFLIHFYYIDSTFETRKFDFLIYKDVSKDFEIVGGAIYKFLPRSFLVIWNLSIFTNVLMLETRLRLFIHSIRNR